MLISTVIDPLAFDPLMFAEPGFPEKSEALLAGLVENGLLLVDSQERLREGIRKAAEQLVLSPKGRNTRIWIEEFLKLGNRRIVKAKQCDSPPQNLNSTESACHLGVKCATDAVVTSSVCANDTTIRAFVGKPLLCVSDYSSLHSLEVHRKELAHDGFQLDVLPETTILDLLGSSVRFTCMLRFYDSQIGRAGTNLRSFRDGVTRILEVFWTRGYFAKDPACLIEVYTKQHALNEAAFPRLSQDFLAPLRNMHPWHVALFVKDDPLNRFHARFLETENILLNFDSGFDLLNARGQWKVNILRRDEKRVALVKEFRRLKNIYEDVN
jgi:hypothetical protein